MSICFLNSTLAYIWKLVMLHLTRQDVLLLLLYIHASGIASVSATGKIKEGKKGDFSGAFTLQGKPKHMEDRFEMIENVEGTGASMFGIFDGHEGASAADYAKHQLVPSLCKQIVNEAKSSKDNLNEVDFGEIITTEQLAADDAFIRIAKQKKDKAGSMVLIAVLHGTWLTVANTGDCRGVMCDSGGNTVALSFDQTVNNLAEHQRVIDAGGQIVDGRLKGELVPLRAFGDYDLKDGTGLIAKPVIRPHDLKIYKPKFLILASDGLWNVFSSKQAVAFIKKHLNEPDCGAESLAREALAKKSTDNITVVVIDMSKRASILFEN